MLLRNLLEKHRRISKYVEHFHERLQPNSLCDFAAKNRLVWV